MSSFWDEFGCMPWTGAVSGGRPMMKFKGKTTTARRVAWEQTRGPIPEGCDVVATCSTPLCCAPAHLALTRTKLSPDDVRHIRGSSLPARVLAAVYGVDSGNIYRIKRRELHAAVE